MRTVTRASLGDFRDRFEPEHVKLTLDPGNKIQTIRWKYGTQDDSLYGIVKKHSDGWNGVGWTFKSPAAADAVLEIIIKRNPDWPIIGLPGAPFLPLADVAFSRIRLNDELEACLLPLPLSWFTSFAGSGSAYLVKDGKKSVGVLIGKADELDTLVASLTQQGAVCDDRLALQWDFAVGSKAQVKESGWPVEVSCDLSNPLHYLAAPPQQYKKVDGRRVVIGWDGKLHTTRKKWAALKEKFQNCGIEWEGDDPSPDLDSAAASFDVSLVHGWESPAPNGYLLHAYQKEGARFAASRSMRALIGDEMGIGKTVQAIAAAEATKATRVLVICPANARYVWDKEIGGWGGSGAVQHVTSQLDAVDMAARWHIVTYDLIATRTETWRLEDEYEKQAFRDVYPEILEEFEKENPGAEYPLKLAISVPLNKIPAFSSKRQAAWGKIMRRLRGELLQALLAAGPMLVILDEAHRVKNRVAKRTKAIQQLVIENKLLMLTGTPLRNNQHEAAALLSLLDAEAAKTLSNEKNYDIQDIKEYLSYFMIRRTKKEVLPDLPAKTRQTIPIDDLDPDHMENYVEALNVARTSHANALKDGKSEAEARQIAQGGIEKARTALALAKVHGGGVVDLVLDVIENKDCCVVFCAHHQVSDDLKSLLTKQRLRAAIIDGRTQQKDRAKIVEAFQSGQLDVVIGGINAAGEAITLTRADTTIFVELDWVPAALLQAEDRIHRVGQKENCHIMQALAVFGNENLDEIMSSLINKKMALIDEVLDEETGQIVHGSVQADLMNRLLQAPSVDIHPGIDPSPEQERLDRKARVDDASGAPIIKTAKRLRGRPKVYVDSAPPSAAERSKNSIKTLEAAGGARVMLRLTAEANEALKAIMEVTGSSEKTATINQAIIALKSALDAAEK